RSTERNVARRGVFQSVPGSDRERLLDQQDGHPGSSVHRQRVRCRVERVPGRGAEAARCPARANLATTIPDATWKPCRSRHRHWRVETPLTHRRPMSIKFVRSLTCGLVCLLIVACKAEAPTTDTPATQAKMPPFQSDLALLNQHTKLVVLTDARG